MAFDSHTTRKNLRHLLPSSLLAGLVGGGLLVLLQTCVHTWCRGGIACYNHGLFDGIGTFQNLVLGILSLLLAGMLPAALQREGGTRRDFAVLAGGIAGFTAFLVLEIYSMVTAVFGHGYAAGLSDVLSLAHDTLTNLFLPLLAIGLAMAALTALGAFVVSLSRERAAGPNEGAAASRLILCSTAALILVVVVLPPLAAHAMLGAGMIDVSPGTALMTTAVSAERTAPGGLEGARGSETAWTGAGVSNNGTPVDVVVTAHGADGSEIIVLSRTI